MRFASIRVITDDVPRLVGFYEKVTGVSAEWGTELFAEIVFPACTLAIGGTPTVRIFGEGVALPAENRTVIVEFQVDDVDAEHERLKGIVADFVQLPTTMPWGNRSLLFRDPDDNLVNLFAPVTPEAIARFASRGG